MLHWTIFDRISDMILKSCRAGPDPSRTQTQALTRSRFPPRPSESVQTVGSQRVSHGSRSSRLSCRSGLNRSARAKALPPSVQRQLQPGSARPGRARDPNRSREWACGLAGARDQGPDDDYFDQHQWIVFRLRKKVLENCLANLEKGKIGCSTPGPPSGSHGTRAWTELSRIVAGRRRAACHRPAICGAGAKGPPRRLGPCFKLRDWSTPPALRRVHCSSIIVPREFTVFSSSLSHGSWKRDTGSISGGSGSGLLSRSYSLNLISESPGSHHFLLDG